MGLLDKLKGIKEPEPGVAPVPASELKEKLMALNDDRIPFNIQAGSGGDEGDLIVDWKIVDAQWYEIFGKANLEKSHTIRLGLGDKDKEVRVLEETREVEWQAGVPSLSTSIQVFKGRTIGEKSFGKAYAWKSVNPLDYGQVYEYKFDVSEMKDPIAAIVTKNGWSYRPVMSRGKLSD
jgi:hypothetical protein